MSDNQTDTLNQSGENKLPGFRFDKFPIATSFPDILYKKTQKF